MRSKRLEIRVMMLCHCIGMENQRMDVRSLTSLKTYFCVAIRVQRMNTGEKFKGQGTRLSLLSANDTMLPCLLAKILL